MRPGRCLALLAMGAEELARGSFGRTKADTYSGLCVWVLWWFVQPATNTIKLSFGITSRQTFYFEKNKDIQRCFAISNGSSSRHG